MAFVRVGFGRFLFSNGSKNLLDNTRCVTHSIRNISGKTTREGECASLQRKPKPYNYEKRRYTFLHSLFDKTTSRFDENTKLIVVEGPVAAGKTNFAKELAKELEMVYLPEANLDMIYTNEIGYDLKQLDDQVPESCRSFDVKDFLLNPRHRLTTSFQLRQFVVKYAQYIDALAHVLSTGQGVILDRCVYSDFVFVEAMYNQNYISKAGRSVYYDARQNSLPHLLRPHLIIYLDVPVQKVLENISKRNISCEKNSCVLTAQYLSDMETHYKHKYLKEMSVHAELLVYDWSYGGDMEIVIEDIERMDFNREDEEGAKFKDWNHTLEEEYAILRNQYADKKDWLMEYTTIPRYDVPELITEAEDIIKFREIWDNAPGNKYSAGYDTSLGDSGILFKMALKHRNTLPRIERKHFG